MTPNHVRCPHPLRWIMRTYRTPASGPTVPHLYGRVQAEKGCAPEPILAARERVLRRQHSTAPAAILYDGDALSHAEPLPNAMKKPLSLPRICIAATGETPAALRTCAEAALRQSRFVELRLDWLKNPSDGIPLIKTLLNSAARSAQVGRPVLQATCRRRESGGRFDGTVARQLEILEMAARGGCHLADLEIESAEAAGPAAVSQLHGAVRLILSWHDFQRTRPLEGAARRLRRFPADYYKIVTTATRQSDNCAVLEFLEGANATEGEAGKWIAFCMGEAGVPSRVLALSRGSAFVYAAPNLGSSAAGVVRKAEDRSFPLAAPGQLDYETLQKRYCAARLTARTKLFGLLGAPVRHSLGAALHNAAFRKLGLDAVYLPLLVSDLRDFREAAARYPLAGFSVTIPHKEAILRYVERADRWVRAAGAANTIRVRRERWEATNKDVEGILRPLRKTYRLAKGARLPKNFQAVIVGAGGAARAAVIALRAMGCRDLAITGRDPVKVRRFAGAFDLDPLPLEELGRERFDLLVQATPVGLWPNAAESLLQGKQIAAETVFDLIYNPPETLLLRLARAQGCRVISGLEMFLAQAASQFEYWTGLPAPLRTMRQAAWDELQRLDHTATP